MELIKKFGAFSIGPMVGSLIGFVTVPMITFFISPSEYGKASMFIVAQGAISVVVYWGMDQAFVREFNKKKDNVNVLMSNAILIPSISVVFIGIVLICNSKFVSMLLFNTPDEKIAVYMLALMFPFMVVENFALLKIRMEERGMLYSAFTILLKILVLALTIAFFILYEKSFRSVVYAMALGEILNGIILYCVSISKMHFKVNHLDRLLIKRMLKFGVPLVPASILVWALTSLDKIMLRAMCGYSELGLYTAAFKIISILSIVQTCFTLFWTPVAYRWYENKVDVTLYKIVNDLVAFVMVEFCIAILAFKDIVAYILGADFKQAIYIFPYLLLYPVMYTISEATCVGIGFKRKTTYNIFISIVAGIINLSLNYLLIPVLYGKGAALATGISYMAFFWMRTIISRNLWYKFPIGNFILYTIVVLINCNAHTFIQGNSPYLISGISIIAILIMNYKLLRILKKNYMNSLKKSTTI